MAISHILRQWLLVRTIAAEGCGVSIKRLIEITGMGDKTIRRDIAQMQQAGLAIVEAVGEFGRKTYAIDAAELPHLNFTYDEALALFLCKQAILPLAGTFFWSSASQAFRKIESSLGPRSRAYVERMRSRFLQTGLAGDYSDKAELLDTIVQGLEECRAVFVAYHSQSSTEPVTRDIFPLGIVEHQGAVYIIAFSPDHHEIRTWKLDRIHSAETTKIPFQRPAGFNLESYLAGSLGMYHGDGDVIVKVRFAPSVARYVGEKKLHPSQTVTMQRDGSALFQVRLSSTTEAKSWILSFGAAAEVLEPSSLRDDLRAELARMQTAYATDPSVTKSPSPKRRAVRHQGK